MGLLFPTLWETMFAMQEMREGSGMAFDGSPEDREHATKEFERHVREVKERVPARRLLVCEVKQGWEPLCEFLGVEAPREPFPHLNEQRAQFPKLMRRAMLSELARSAGKLVAVASALVLVLSVLRRAPSS